jgi:hypothetical protein
MAGLVAGAFSMALGEFSSVETRNSAVRAEVAVEREELRRHPDAERAELVGMYRDMGLTEDTARRLTPVSVDRCHSPDQHSQGKGQANRSSSQPCSPGPDLPRAPRTSW